MKNLYFKFIYKVLARYARKLINKYDPFVIAVTGSAGKTSTKEAIYQVLHEKYGDKVRKNFGNLNAEIGIPLTILGYDMVPNKYIWPIFLLLAGFKTRVRNYPKYLVLEMGVEHKGDINYFCSIAKPDIAVITSASPAHTANFNSLSEFQKEKLSILKNLKPDGKAVLNFDDPVLSKTEGDNVSFISIENNNAKYWAENIKLSLDGTEFRIASTGRKISVKSKLLGKQTIYPQLFAFAVADLMDIPQIETGKSLEKNTPIAGRLNLIEGKDSVLILDDTYNSNPASAKLALDFLSEVAYNGRKVAILGNMNELGDYEKSSHEEIAEYAKERCDLAVFVGSNSTMMQKKYGEGALKFNSRKELISNLGKIIKPKDLVLVKASQNKNFLEEVVKELMKHPEKAGDLLVRQGKFWQKKK